MAEQESKFHLFLFYGTDEFAIRMEVTKMIRAMGEGSTASMNISTLEGEGLDQNAFITATHAMPFLASRRLVILNDPLAAFRNAETKDKLISLIASVPRTTDLVLVQELDRYGGNNKPFETWRNRLLKSQQSMDNLKEMRKDLPKYGEMKGRIKEEVARQSALLEKPVKISDGAVILLEELVGDETRIASQEIGKLLEYVNYERDITREDVEKVGIASASASIFVLQDALGKKDLRAGQKALSRLLQDWEAPAIWGMLQNYFRNLLLTRELLDAHGNVQDVMRELNQKEYTSKKLVEQAGHFTQTSLDRLHHRLLELDEAIKTSQVTADLALELLVAELAG